MRKLMTTLLIVMLLVACTPVDKPKEKERVLAKYDLIKDDVFLLMQKENFTGHEISVLGVQLNDDKNFVIELLGSPDNFTRFEGADLIIENLEYGASLGLEKNGLVVHLENDVVTRITVTRSFNPLLKDTTKLGKTNEQIYFTIGVADEKEIMDRYIVLKYNKYGIEFITFRGDEIALSVVSSSETNRDYVTISDLEYIPYSDTIVFQ